MTLPKATQSACQLMIFLIMRQGNIISQIINNLIKFIFRQIPLPRQFKIFLVLVGKYNLSHNY